jgi:hypothetical protein
MSTSSIAKAFVFVHQPIEAPYHLFATPRTHPMMTAKTAPNQEPQPAHGRRGPGCEPELHIQARVRVQGGRLAGFLLNQNLMRRILVGAICRPGSVTGGGPELPCARIAPPLSDAPAAAALGPANAFRSFLGSVFNSRTTGSPIVADHHVIPAVSHVPPTASNAAKSCLLNFGVGGWRGRRVPGKTYSVAPVVCTCVR